MHRDFAPEQAGGLPLGAGRRAARDEPGLLQHVRAGLLGLHAPRRGARHLQDAGAVLQRVDHAVAARTRSTASCRRRSTRPTTSSTAGSSTRGSRRSAMEAAEPQMRALCRRLVEDVAAERRMRLRHGVRAALPHRGVPQRDRHRPRRRRPVRPVGRGLLQRLRRRPRRPGGDGRRRSTGSASTGSPRWPSAAATPAPREGDLASHLLHSTFDDRPLTDAEMLDMLTVLVLAGLDTTRATLGYMFRHLADASRAPPPPDRRAGADPVRGRGGRCASTRSSSATAAR